MAGSRHEVLLETLAEAGPLGSTALAERLQSVEPVSLPTVKRDLADLAGQGLVTVDGKGRATRYSVTAAYRLLRPIDVARYFQREADDRPGVRTAFNWDLLDELPDVTLFTPAEADRLAGWQSEFEARIATLTGAGLRKEQERLAVDLSWKSSQIEGNTYSLLETERLLRERQTADGKTQEEAIMLLNHKDAIDFIAENPDVVKPLTVAAIEDIHALLVKELGVERNVRTRRVGISGTNYQPLDNEFQIREALTATCELINARENAFEQALLGLALISYIQPFMDGNKRSARIVANALLMANGCCPISFRTVDSVDYKKAMLIFYERNNISSFKRIFIEQFEFAVNTYF